MTGLALLSLPLIHRAPIRAIFKKGLYVTGIISAKGRMVWGLAINVPIFNRENDVETMGLVLDPANQDGVLRGSDKELLVFPIGRDGSTRNLCSSQVGIAYRLGVPEASPANKMGVNRWRPPRISILDSDLGGFGRREGLRHLNALDTHPSPLILMEIVDCRLQRGLGILVRGLSRNLHGACLRLQLTHRVVDPLIDASSAIREIPGCIRILLRRISANSCGGDQLLGLNPRILVVAVSNIELNEGRQGDYGAQNESYGPERQFYKTVGLGLPQIDEPSAYAALAFILAWLCACALVAILVICGFVRLVQEFSPRQLVIASSLVLGLGILAWLFAHLSEHLAYS